MSIKLISITYLVVKMVLKIQVVPKIKTESYHHFPKRQNNNIENIHYNFIRILRKVLVEFIKSLSKILISLGHIILI